MNLSSPIGFNESSYVPNENYTSCDRQTLEDAAVGAVLFVIASLSFPVHLILIVAMSNSDTRRHDVSMIFASLAYSNLVGSIFYIWIALVYGLQKPLGTDTAFFTAYIPFISNYMNNLLISLNRVVSIACPLRYDSLFATRKLRGYIVIVWIVSLSCIVPYGMPGCRLIVDFQNYAIDFEDNHCGFAMRMTNMVYGVLVHISTALDVFTFFKMRIQRLKVAGFMAAPSVRRRRRSEMTFLLQALVSSLIGTFTVLLIDYLPLLTETKWEHFVTSTAAPALLYGIDSFTIILLNDRLRGKILACLSKLRKLLQVQNLRGLL